MKIISDFKDYYDYGIAFGIDENIVYERFQKEIAPPKHIQRRHGGIIGFCDEFWEVKEVQVADAKVHSWKFRHRGGETETYKDRAEKLLEDGWIEGSAKYDPIIKSDLIGYYWIKPIENINRETWGYRSYYNANFSPWNNWVKSIFSEYSVPSFYITEKPDEVILNPNLSDYGLQKVMDSVEAFQKLSTFLPGLKTVDPFEMTNEQLGKSKGFDEYSFRNKNTKNKPKKF